MNVGQTDGARPRAARFDETAHGGLVRGHDKRDGGRLEARAGDGVGVGGLEIRAIDQTLGDDIGVAHAGGIASARFGQSQDAEPCGLEPACLVGTW